MLHVHRAERADGLVRALADVVRPPLVDPMETEIVAVPTRGVERWLTQRLAGLVGTSAGRGDGVCANVDFPFPGRLVAAAVAQASGIDGERDPWLPERAVWPLLEVIDAALGEPWLRELSAHLGKADDAVRRSRRFTAARHIAELFDRYAVQRPELVRSFAAGGGDGWQPELWRRLRARIDVPGPAERLAGVCARLRAEPGLAELPARLSLFGLTRLPASHLDVLHALAAGRDVHLFLLHPSAVLWARVAAALVDRTPPVARREQGRIAHVAANPLLASWGRDARELQLVVARVPGAVDHEHGTADPGAVPATLLARVQADVRGDRMPDGTAALDAVDASISVHACHGRARQVEVVRDAILHLLADDPTLEPRDVVVMCPDIEAFAPLVHATFGSTAPDDDEPAAVGGAAVDLRVRLADRALRQTNPVLGVVADLLDLAGSRLTASQVLDLAGRAPVRRRFRLDDDDLARVARWADASGVRWALDAAQRAPYKLERLHANTWQAGFDRVLVGVAMAEEGQRLVGDVLPLDDVGSTDIDVAGRFAELLDRLHAVVEAFGDARPLADWADVLAEAADALTDTGPRDAWQRAGLARLLDEVAAEAAESRMPLTLPEVRALLASRLGGRPTRASFRTGHLTICTLVPMRSVPHRVVCLMGLDDGHFPRQAPPDGDDLIAAEPHVGDRDPRSEDRQLLLDALLAATERLVITYTGRHERTNLPLPPAVPLGELLDVLERTAPGARERVVVEHPLQPFDPENFTPPHPRSFDRAALDGARALAGERHVAPPFLAGPLPPATVPAPELDALVRFVKHPVRAFLRQRLGVIVADRDDDLDDALPVDLDALEQWGVGERLLAARLGGAALQAAVAAEVGRGLLPPGALAGPFLARIEPAVERLVALAGAALGGAPPAATVEVRVALADGRILTGAVPGVHGDVVAAISFSRLAARHRVAAWVRLLALAAAHPERRFEAVTLGRRRAGGAQGATGSLARLQLGAADEAAVREQLAAVVDLHERGLREPLPLACATSAAYAAALAGGRNAEAAARSVWTTTPRGFPAEDRDREHVLVHGGVISFDTLLAARPAADEAWTPGERTRFGAYARRLWDPLLAAETVTDA